ncbi:hypothetical protein LCGC14_2197820 [marine sediment metagenome]|uniref:Uncharacterized protein n=1 Tax=marine sediment metagenome TaxID=412755 RepID=A0A0F9DHS0_9ZZZZ
MVARYSGSRASLLGAQIVNGFAGTHLVIVADEAGTAYPASYGGSISQGAIVYSANIDLRVTANKTASTALTHPQPGYLRADTEYAFPISTGVSYLSFTAKAEATAELTWVLGQGA